MSQAPAQAIPTFTGIVIRTVEEANRLFHVVRLGRAKLFTRRLTVEERRAIYTGCVFVWEERNQTLEAVGVRHVHPCMRSAISSVL